MHINFVVEFAETFNSAHTCYNYITACEVCINVHSRAYFGKHDDDDDDDDDDNDDDDDDDDGDSD